MNVLYADTSALVRAYLADEPDHPQLRLLLLESGNAVVSSEIARVEFASAVTAAERSSRLAKAEILLNRFDADCQPGGAIGLLALDTAHALGLARDLVRSRSLRTLDAIHLAVALTDGVRLAGSDLLTLVTRDADQANAATALGLPTI